MTSGALERRADAGMYGMKHASRVPRAIRSLADRQPGTEGTAVEKSCGRGRFRHPRQERVLNRFRILIAAGLLAAASFAPAIAADISGAGATFPYPIYAKWADAYKKE